MSTVTSGALRAYEKMMQNINQCKLSSSNNHDHFSQEEINILVLCNTSRKDDLLSDLYDIFFDVYDPDLKKIIHHIIKKVKYISHSELSKIDQISNENFEIIFSEKEEISPKTNMSSL